MTKIPIQLPSKAQEAKYTATWRVVLPMRAHQQLMHYVDKFAGECSGAALVEHSMDKLEHTFTIGDVFLPAEQKNTGSSTDIEADAVGRLVTQLVRDGRSPEKLRCHWHSHASMSVFHSGTDEDNYKVLKTGEWLVSLVLNKAGEVKASVHYYQPFTFTVENVPVTVMLEEMSADPAWDEHVKAVERYEEAHRPKVQTYEGYDSEYDKHAIVGSNKWQREYEARGELAVRELDILLSMSGYLVLAQPTARWDSAEVLVIDQTTERVKRLTLEVDDLRPASHEDIEKAGLPEEGGLLHDDVWQTD